jgi:hypothetical protein
MGREQIVQTNPRQRVDDKERCRRRILLRGRALDLAGRIVELAERRDEPERVSRQLSTAAVGSIFARVRLIAIGTSMVASGARKMASNAARPPPRLPSLSRRPPNNPPNCASIKIAPAIVAVTVIVKCRGS